MATSEGIPSSIDIEFLELNDNPYIKIYIVFLSKRNRGCKYAILKHILLPLTTP